jgi:hypothetical protein
MIESLLKKWRARKNGKVSRRVPRKAVPVRPVLEGLEERCVPSTNDIWTTTSAGNWSRGANWSLGHAPTIAAGEIAVFDHNTSDASCTVDVAAECLGLQEKNGYAGTLTVNKNLEIGSDPGSVITGTVNQNATATITVDSGGRLTVNGGKLNDSANRGTVNVNGWLSFTGSSGEFGSDIVVKAGGVLQLGTAATNLSGIVTVKNNAKVTINAASGTTPEGALEVYADTSTSANAGYLKYNTGTTAGIIDNFGLVWRQGNGEWRTDLPIVNEGGGTVEVHCVDDGGTHYAGAGIYVTTTGNTASSNVSFWQNSNGSLLVGDPLGTATDLPTLHTAGAQKFDGGGLTWKGSVAILKTDGNHNISLSSLTMDSPTIDSLVKFITGTGTTTLSSCTWTVAVDHNANTCQSIYADNLTWAGGNTLYVETDDGSTPTAARTWDIVDSPHAFTGSWTTVNYPTLGSWTESHTHPDPSDYFDEIAFAP